MKGMAGFLTILLIELVIVQMTTGLLLPLP